MTAYPQKSTTCPPVVGFPFLYPALPNKMLEKQPKTRDACQKMALPNEGEAL